MTAKSGDHVVLFRFDGKCDLFKIDETGKRVSVSANLASPQRARALAREGSATGQLWVCDEATPAVITPY